MPKIDDISCLQKFTSSIWNSNLYISLLPTFQGNGCKNIHQSCGAFNMKDNPLSKVEIMAYGRLEST